MNWSRVGTVLAVLALLGLAVGAATSLLDGGVLATRTSAYVLGIVAVVVAVLTVAGSTAAGNLDNPYW